MLITLGPGPFRKPSFVTILTVHNCPHKEGVLTSKGRRQIRTILKSFQQQDRWAERVIIRLVVGDIRPTGIEGALRSFANQVSFGCVEVDMSDDPVLIKEWEEFGKTLSFGMPKDALARLRELTGGLSDELISELEAEQ